MSVRIAEYQSTPNPNAIKCVADKPVPAPSARMDRPRSYQSVDAASGDSFARTLLQVPGVRSVLVMDTWFTISKDGTAEWRAIKAAIERAIADV